MCPIRQHEDDVCVLWHIRLGPTEITLNCKRADFELAMSQCVWFHETVPSKLGWPLMGWQKEGDVCVSSFIVRLRTSSAVCGSSKEHTSKSAKMWF